MFVISNFIIALAKIVDMALTLYLYIIIARAVLSWVNPDPYNPIVSFIHRVTDPVLYKVRRILPDFGGIDFSPMLVIGAIFFIQNFLLKSLFEIGYRLKMPGGFP